MVQRTKETIVLDVINKIMIVRWLLKKNVDIKFSAHDAFLE